MLKIFFSEAQNLFEFLSRNISRYQNLSNQSIENQSILIDVLCESTKKLSFLSHGLRHNLDWSGAFNQEWYNHTCDLYFQFPTGTNSHWLERGVFSNFVIDIDANVLELCCGDGFFAHHFYSTKACKVTSIDFDKNAIKHAQEKYGSNPRLQFLVGDIRENIPNGQYDNVVWDAAIEHFTEEEIDSILLTIKDRLGSSGVLSGQTIKNNGVQKQLEHHEKEFESKEELKRMLSKYFTNVVVLESVHRERHNFYFFASDGELPLK